MILDTPWPDIIARGVLLAIAAIIWVVVLIRLNGLRSLSKMTNFDFVMTVALGSLVAGVVSGAVIWRAGPATRLKWGAFAMVVTSAAPKSTPSMPETAASGTRVSRSSALQLSLIHI